MKLAICYLYASGMNVYGDRGNVTTLAQRCRWRGIEVDVAERGVGENGRLDQFDLIFAGGGQDRDQVAVSQDLQGDAGRALRDAVEADSVVLTVCGTYQLLGHYFKTGAGHTLPGIGVFDAWTVAGTKRHIGDAVVGCDLGDGETIELVGFENHSGRTFLGPNGRPLGRAVVGAGNNGEDGTEGAAYRNAFGTYLHGPLLPKNPRFADHLIRLALRRRYGADAELPPLDDSFELDAHARIVDRVHRRGRVRSGVR
jgi:lipid II isoglutaminyl synthase (glutamine-hydrolysing)